ncbi:MAG: polyprenyl diphosphate synthase [Candidatus Woesearchaeota archaeon]|nr:polyprenyl diphosphate synthase [Candidatus Woesearchaeota archaeon]
MAEGPKHVGIILDGNRRFAKRLMKRPWEGHKLGFDKVKKLFDWTAKLGIKELTLYCFSMQNFNRPKKEFEYLMKQFKAAFEEIPDNPDIKKNRIRIKAIGRTGLLPEEVQEAIKKAEYATNKYNNYLINIAIAYGGREEIIDAVKRIGRLIEKGKIKDKDITEELVRKNLYTGDEPDLIIRTGGEQRTSNFLIWQSNYSEWIFIEKMWPEFEEEDLIQCIKDYKERERRYGS